jgi:formyltetrahydrofolate hydrolase
VPAVVQAHGVELVALQRYVDPATGWHYSRSELDETGETVSATDLRRTLAPLAAQVPLHVRVAAAHERNQSWCLWARPTTACEICSCVGVTVSWR